MRPSILLLLLIGLFGGFPVLAFQSSEGCEPGKCTDCHSLNPEEASEIFKDIPGDILSVEPAEVPGLWRIELKTTEKVFPFYLDFSKTYLISGDVIRLQDRKNLTEERRHDLNPIDPASLPTEDALLLGSPQAKQRIIVFTDPRCRYCSKLHQAMKQAIQLRSDLLFLIKLLPLKQSSLDSSRTIACNHSLDFLEAAFADQTLPAQNCETHVIEQNLTLARDLGIRTAPTLILPDGKVVSGYQDPAGLLKLIDQARGAEPSGKNPEAGN